MLHDYLFQFFLGESSGIAGFFTLFKVPGAEIVDNSCWHLELCPIMARPQEQKSIPLRRYELGTVLG